MRKSKWQALVLGIGMIAAALFPVKMPEARAEGQIRITCVGDSLTEGYTSSTGLKGAKSYPSRLQTMLGSDYVVTNCGKSSASLLNDGPLQYKTTTEYRNSLTSNPDIVIIMLGTNDSKRSIWNAGGRSDEEAKAEFTKDAEALVAEYQALPSHPQIIFATSPVVYHMADKQGIRARVMDEQIVPLQRELAQKHNWDMIDMYALTEDVWTKFHPSDGVHFTDHGYLYEAECMYTAITGKAAKKDILPVLSAKAGTVQPASGTVDAKDAAYAIDDDYDTLWHSSYAEGDDATTKRDRHWIDLELEQKSEVSMFGYLPRQDKLANGTTQVNGRVTQYEIQVSSDGENYTTVAAGTWENNDAWKYAALDQPVSASYVRLVCKAAESSVNNQLSSAAEVRVYGTACSTTSGEELKTAVKQAEQRYTNAGAYGSECWADFRQKLQAAKALADAKKEETDEEVHRAYCALRQSVSRLEDSAKDYDPLTVMSPEYYVAKDGTILPYRIFLPDDYQSGRNYPVILFFHGADYRGYDNVSQIAKFTWTNSTQKKTNMDEIGFYKKALTAENRSKYPAIIIAPQCPPADNASSDNSGSQWVDTPWGGGNYTLDNVPVSNEMQAVDEMMDNICSAYHVNENRMYTAGMSMGGYAVWNLIMRHPEKYTAAVAVSGAADVSKAELLKEFPIWGIHGSNDTVVPFGNSTKAMMEALQAAGNTKTTYTELTAGHEIVKSFWKNDAYNVLEWLFAYSKADAGALSEKIDEMTGKAADGLDAYTSATADAFLEALADAKKLLANDSTPQAELDAAVSRLEQAWNALQVKADTKELEEKMAEWKKIDLSGYTAESAAYFQKALADAEKLLADDGTPQEEINAALAALTKAAEALQKKAVEPPAEDPEQPPAPEIKVPKVKLSSVKKAGNAVRIKWKKVKGATGYQVARKIGKKGKYKIVRKIKKVKTTVYRDKKVKAGKKYFYKVRAFRKVNGKVYYGKYSKQKAVRR